MRDKSGWFLLREPFYPVLVALYAVLFLYSENLSLVIDSDVLVITVAVLIVTAIVWAVAQLLLKNRHRAAAVATIWLLVLLGFGHVANLVWPQPDTANYPALWVGFLIVAVLLTLLVRRAGGLQQFTVSFNVIALALLIMPVVQIMQYHTRQPAIISNAQAVSAASPRVVVNNDAQHPDVYYIILDGYSSNAHLLREWNYSNSAFTYALEERGFLVAHESTANYAATLASLPSSLNMRYLDESERQPAPHLDVAYTRSLMADSVVAQQFQDLGYSYIHIMSGFTVDSSIADINIDIYPDGAHYFSSRDGERSVCSLTVTCSQKSFVPFFLSTTALLPVIETPLVANWLATYQTTADWSESQPLEWSHPNRALAIWDETEKIAAIPEATFTFSHIIKPHGPVIFDAAGNLHQPDESRFFEQLEFVNQRTLDMVDRIIEQSSVPPIIIVQGDHGTDLGDVWNDSHTHLVFFEILNALYWPGLSEETIPRDITPVNTFRLLFNQYFGGDFELLESRHYDLPQGYDNLFNMVEVDLDEVISNPERYR